MVNQRSCAVCHQWAGVGHVCPGEVPRCGNPRCRRILPTAPAPGPGQLCARCEVRGAIRGQLPANTGRPVGVARQVRAGIAALEAARQLAEADGPAEVDGGQGAEQVPLWRRVQLRARSALLGED